MPVLGICRGIQVMAVAHGGTLVQHLPDVPSALVHRERPGAFVEHGARFAAGSLAARSSDRRPFIVNSSHHQSVDSAGSLVVTGWADDGTIEVCEDPTADFCLGRAVASRAPGSPRRSTCRSCAPSSRRRPATGTAPGRSTAG